MCNVTATHSSTRQQSINDLFSMCPDDIGNLPIQRKAEFLVAIVPMIHHCMNGFGNDAAFELQNGGGSSAFFAPRDKSDRGCSVTKKAIYDRRFNGTIVHVRGRANFNADHQRKFAGIGLGPCRNCRQSIQARIATHSHDVEPTAIASQIEHLDQVRAQTRRQKSRRRDAAQITNVLNHCADLVQTTQKRSRTHVDPQFAVLLQKLALCFELPAAIGLLGRQRQMTTLDETIAKNVRNTLVSDVKEIQNVVLRIRRRLRRGAYAEDS